MIHTSIEKLEQHQALHTATEIRHQPDVWQELWKSLSKQKETLQAFIHSIFNKHDQVRVILTGAGTSAFIGNILVPVLRTEDHPHVHFESIPTTDIVSNPKNYFLEEVPTILVSFARSGNSPESVATVALGKKIVKDFYQVVITCNKEGQLAKNIEHDEQSLTVLTPEKAHDKGFAMTSSFTSMLMAAYEIFSGETWEEKEQRNLITHAESFIDSVGDSVDEISNFHFDRLVYLGSGSLGQLAHEAALKMLELTAGKIVATYESSLGFRHGPKSILNEHSLVVLFLSQDPYTRKYDLDMLRELAHDPSGAKVVALTERENKEVRELADWTIVVNQTEENLSSDMSLAVLYIVFAQTLALKKSIDLGVTPDNPSPDGRVNRVVQGVKIHDFENLTP